MKGRIRSMARALAARASSRRRHATLVLAVILLVLALAGVAGASNYKY